MTTPSNPPNASPLAAFVADGAAAGEWTLDPAGTRIEFHSSSIWGLAKVHGHFATVRGGGVVAADGTATGQIDIEAASVESKQKQRDKHLRSPEFFDVEQHPLITYAVDGVTPSGGEQVEVRGTITARGHAEPAPFTARVTAASADAVTIEGELAVDRSRFGMTWSPARVSTMHNRIAVTVRFTRTGS